MQAAEPWTALAVPTQENISTTLMQEGHKDEI